MFSLRQLILLKSSLLYAWGTTVLSLFFGLPVAFFLERTNLPFKKIIRILILIPILIPPYLHAIAWRFIGYRLSVIGYRFDLYNLPSAILITAFAYYPIVTLLVSHALNNLDARLEEAGELFTNRWQIFRHITFPLLRPAILTSALLLSLLTLTDFGIPALLHINVFVFEIFAQFSAFFDYNRAFILTWPLLLITLFLLFTFHLLLKGKAFVSLSSSTRPLKPIKLNLLMKFIVLSYSLLLLLLSVFIPLASFFLEVGSVENFVFALKSSSGVIANSLWLAGLGAVITVFLSLAMIWLKTRPPARGWSAFGGKGRYSRVSQFLSFSVSQFLVLLPIAIPGVTIGILLIKLFNRPVTDVIYTSSLIIVIGYVVRFFPFAFEILRNFFVQIDPKLLEAAQLSGASSTQILIRILFPLLLPGIVSAFIISFVLSLTELGTTILVYPSGYQTLPIRIYALMHYGAPELVAALSLILIIIVVCAILSLWMLLSFSKLVRNLVRFGR